MLVRYKDSHDETVDAYKPASTLSIRIRRVARRSYLLQSAARTLARTHDAWSVISDDRSDVTARLLETTKPDVVNLHFCTGFVDFPSFFRYYADNVPIVVTMHDMWPITGGCHYAGKCGRYQSACGKCPVIKSAHERDATRGIWSRKRRAYSRLRTNRQAFVADSYWLAELAKASSLLKDSRIETIYYGVDTRTYAPGPRDTAKKALQLDPAIKVILFISANVDDPRKGLQHLRDAISGSEELRECQYVSIGAGKIKSLTGVRHRHLGSVENDTLLAAVYRAADVFVMPSLEEAFGQTALESIACGTPVVAFAAGGIPEIVRHGCTGLLAPVGDSRKLGVAVVSLLQNRTLSEALASQGREVAVNEFRMEANSRKYIELYNSLLQYRG